MRHRRTPVALVSALLAALAVGACDGSERRAQTSPTEPKREVTVAPLVVEGYTAVRDPASTSFVGVSLSRLFDANGGELSLFGHTLRVPAGTVSTPTVFTLNVLPTGYIHVDLTAAVGGGLVATQAQGGFGKDASGVSRRVFITLSYARSEVADPSNLRVLWVEPEGPGRLKLLGVTKSSVDPERKTVTAELEHFSHYLVANP